MLNKRFTKSPMKRLTPQQKKPIQFSKKQCIYADLMVVLVLFMDFLLKWNGHEGMSDVAIAVVSMFGGFVTGGYFTLSGARDLSLNKYQRNKKTDSTEEQGG